MSSMFSPFRVLTAMHAMTAATDSEPTLDWPAPIVPATQVPVCEGLSRDDIAFPGVRPEAAPIAL